MDSYHGGGGVNLSSTDRLAAAGRALYGKLWQSELARDLGKTDRTIRRWASGQEPPTTIWPEVRALLERRSKVIDEVIKSLPE
jgi:predicted transcriptional regulator